MRDYTRKAKIKDSNEWVIGYHVYVDYLDKHYILVSEKTHDGFSGMLAMNQYEVDGDTICNPTGLTDKNGNKIWENDVVKDTDIHLLGSVEYDEEHGMYVINEVNDGYQNFQEFWSCTEAIGNIFDNADLLKGE